MQNLALFIGTIAITTALWLSSMLPTVSSKTVRTVIDNERGLYYVFPHDKDWKKVGAYIGLPHYEDIFSAMNPEAIKGIHGRFQHFHPQDEKDYVYFPYAELKKYELDELAQRRPPLWITATYQGKKRPVIFEWQSKEKAQAVNIGDQRYIDFFIKNYVRDRLQKGSYQNLWVGLDNCAFIYNLYGVFDDKNNYNNKIKWDRPFPQNDKEFIQAVEYFFKRLKETSPDIKIICNEGSIYDESLYKEIFAHTDGVLLEDFLGEVYNSDSALTRLRTYRSYQRMQNFSANKLQIYQPNTRNKDELIHNMYLAYLIFGGKNRFYSGDDGHSLEIDPKRYAKIKNLLGDSITPAQDKQEFGKSEGYRLYWRFFEGGVAYFNLTGKTQAINLNQGKKYFDEYSNSIKQVSIKDKEAKYILFSSENRTAKPIFYPIRAITVAGSVSVEIGTMTPNASIRYTLDGSDPNQNSLLYTKPIKLTKSTVVKAKAFGSNLQESFVSTTFYSITDKQPSVEFHLSSNSSSEFLKADYPLVSLSHISAKPITVNYSVIGGTATSNEDYKLLSGSLIFLPGEKYKYFSIDIRDDKKFEKDESIEVSLSQPKNAYLGYKKVYRYTIQDNDKHSFSKSKLLTSKRE
ncbi:chitobiase/beta-hexosaminidase C-terminal domain-containing protein [Scytonema sp. NUACC26]|uniref:chitobiase/beta-hexosaminidase C-terminal domain-containing protein n=1 Tax=Scytonema sp. NUACC26 TaxID=3140176 RepID=UPI0034DC3FA7